MVQFWEEDNQRPLEKNREHKPVYQQPKLTGKPPEKTKKGNFTIRLKEKNIMILNFQRINQIYVSTRLFSSLAYIQKAQNVNCTKNWEIILSVRYNVAYFGQTIDDAVDVFVAAALN